MPSPRWSRSERTWRFGRAVGPEGPARWRAPGGSQGSCARPAPGGIFRLTRGRDAPTQPAKALARRARCRKSLVRYPAVPDIVDRQNGDVADFTKQALDPNVCFLCARALDEVSRSREHVFPKWLLERCELWDAELSLLNRTTIPYRQLTIACCKECNNEQLAPLEAEVGAAFAAGPDEVRNLDPDRLFVWLAKFYYGLLFRELTLFLERSDPAQGAIVTEELLREYGIHHLLMRRLLGHVEWNVFQRASSSSRRWRDRRQVSTSTTSMHSRRLFCACGSVAYLWPLSCRTSVRFGNLA
jgi:hypothetical protein